jgi:rfaE bifunctional protein kinase chain/domain
MTRREKITGASTTVDLLVLAEIVERFTAKTVVILGDSVADSFQYGEITRVSREAPVLILRHRESRIVPGGGANAANNFASLGARAIPVTAVGDDTEGDAIVALFREKKIDLSGVVRAKGWRTPTKTRFLAGWAHTVGQQVLRVDYEPETELSETACKKIAQCFAAKIGKADALAISDYGFGAATPVGVRALSARVRREIPITLDSRHRLGEFLRARVSAATPNEAELETLHHTSIGRNLAELERCGQSTLRALKLSSLLVTRGRDGMALFRPGLETAHIPVHGSDQAVDVTGAGDTVLAAYTLALASGAKPLEAAFLANIAGGLVVMKRGTATVSQEELLNAIKQSASEPPA